MAVEDGVEVAEMVDDLLGDQAGKPRHARERAEAPRRYGKVKAVGLAVVAEELGDATEVEQLLVVELAELGGGTLDRRLGGVTT